MSVAARLGMTLKDKQMEAILAFLSGQDVFVTEFVGEAQIEKDVIHKALDGEVQLVFISPESIICKHLYRGMLMSSVYKSRLVALVTDLSDVSRRAGSLTSVWDIS